MLEIGLEIGQTTDSRLEQTRDGRLETGQRVDSRLDIW